MVRSKGGSRARRKTESWVATARPSWSHTAGVAGSQAESEIVSWDESWRSAARHCGTAKDLAQGVARIRGCRGSETRLRQQDFAGLAADCPQQQCGGDSTAACASRPPEAEGQRSMLWPSGQWHSTWGMAATSVMQAVSATKQVSVTFRIFRIAPIIANPAVVSSPCCPTEARWTPAKPAERDLRPSRLGYSCSHMGEPGGYVCSEDADRAGEKSEAWPPRKPSHRHWFQRKLSVCGPMRPTGGPDFAGRFLIDNPRCCDTIAVRHKI